MEYGKKTENKGGNSLEEMNKVKKGGVWVLGLLLRENRGIHECRERSDDDGGVFVAGDYQEE